VTQVAVPGAERVALDRQIAQNTRLLLQLKLAANKSKMKGYPRILLKTKDN
jgi:hypothetical protein